MIGPYVVSQVDPYVEHNFEGVTNSQFIYHQSFSSLFCSAIKDKPNSQPIISRKYDLMFVSCMFGPISFFSTKKHEIL